MVYISPTQSFNNPRNDLTANDAGQLVKVQIENGAQVGWKPEDILLFTNFPYEYRQIKSMVLKNVDFFDRKPQVSKINAIIKIFKLGKIKKNETYMFHDLDAYQLVPIKDDEIKIKSDEIALTDFRGIKKFGSENRWNTSVIFFRSGVLDIFKKMAKICYEKGCDEEEALGLLTRDDAKIKKRVKNMNISYNFNGFNLEKDYKEAIKPIRIIHFHPYGVIRQLKVDRPFDFFMGQNKLHLPLISERLFSIFRYHRIS